MSLSPERRKEMLTATRASAVAFIEDVGTLRKIVQGRNAGNPEIRQAAVILRRILIDRELEQIAAPRVGRICLRSPDNDRMMKFLRHRPVSFFGSAGVETYIAYLRSVCALGHAVTSVETARMADINNSFDQTNKVRTHGFLSQMVLCLENRWATRGDVIKYVCYVGRAVHPGSSKDNCNEELLTEMKNGYFYGTRGTEIIFGKYNVQPSSDGFRYTPDTLDPIGVELLAAAKYFYESEEVIDLENIIAKELGPYLTVPARSGRIQHR